MDKITADMLYMLNGVLERDPIAISNLLKMLDVEQISFFMGDDGEVKRFIEWVEPFGGTM